MSNKDASNPGQQNWKPKGRPRMPGYFKASVTHSNFGPWFGSAQPERSTGALATCGPCSDNKIKSTVRYLGIEVDDALEMAEKVDV